MDVYEFINTWQAYQGNEKQGASAQFQDICRVVRHKTPAEADPDAKWFTTEMGVEKAGGGHGWADAWKKGFFAWEYKSPGEDLKKAYQQLQQYRENLLNPPLLVVSDMKRFEVHTNFTDSVAAVHRFTLEQLAQESTYEVLYNVFHAPSKLKPEETPEGVTKDVADRFAGLADGLRKAGYPPRKVAHFLTQLVFCLFAEDVGLLPSTANGKHGLMSQIIAKSQRDNSLIFPEATRELFKAMAVGGRVWTDQVQHFNGGLFEPEDGEFFIPALSKEQLGTLYNVAGYDWQSVEPSIFGTLFERGLDPDKRSQLGAHYTSRDDIVAIVEPALMAPLRREWEAIREAVTPRWERGEGPHLPSPSPDDATHRLGEGGSVDTWWLQEQRDGFLERLRTVRVLDPACGSGNFLYVSLNLLKDLEKEVMLYPAFKDLERPQPTYVTPAQLHGIEISEYAHELASVVVWIGYIQWFKRNGYEYTQTPVLQKLNTVECKDAILGVTEAGELYKPEWPTVDVIVGNPPFLGGNKIRQELGSDIVDDLFSLYRELPNSIDLVCYWFEQAREHIMQGKAKRAGLLATQGIRGGTNREVLQKIQDTGSIFFAYSDRPWILDGAAVRVSMVGFDNGGEAIKALDGTSVSYINSDLTAGIDLAQAKQLRENQRICFKGEEKGGSFDIPGEVARQMLNAPLNPNGRPNSDVVRQWYNGLAVTRRPRDFWIIDFGVDMPLEQAALYELPFEYVQKHVKPERETNRSQLARERWWIHRRSAPPMRDAISGLLRFIATPEVSKHRVFVWIDGSILPDHQLLVFAREDDYFFGVLHSKAHELWALRQGTHLEDRPRYTPTTTFETFPMPWSPGHEPTDDSCYKAIEEAARALNEKRERWLNPERTPNMEEQEWQRTLKKRTLTALYNERPTWLQQAHEKLDRAVFAAYGWEYPLEDEEMLRRLLGLNLERAG